MALPDFFVIGAPKAGTTALHVALARHPQLYLSRVKEPKHFLTDGPPPRTGGPGDAKTFREHVWRREDYEALFDGAAEGTLRGESTPFYLWDRGAQLRIREAVSDAKLIALLRDPVDRAHSNWAHLWSAGLEPQRDFVRACREEATRAAAGWAPFWQYLSLGRYGEQLQHLFSVFPRHQVLVLRYRALRDEPRETLETITTFLGVAPGQLDEVPAENVTAHVPPTLGNRALSAGLRAGAAVEHRLPDGWWDRASSWLTRHLQRGQRTRPPLTPEQRRELVGHFAEDIELLERLTEQSYGDWLDGDRELARRVLNIERKIGTGHNSIDRPIRDI